MTTSLTPNRIQEALNKAHALCSSITDGKNADYIPALAEVPSQLFGIAAVTTDGHIYTVGDAETTFAIESISKAFNLALVMDTIGSGELRTKVGADPTGEHFNSVMAIELHGGKPLNPLVNAGAMAAVSLVPGESSDEIWASITQNLHAFAGAELPINEEIYSSESATNQHNRGIAWLLKSYGFFYNDPTIVVDLYTRMCSLNVTTKQLAIMGACYAHRGVNPITGKRVVREENVSCILAEMAMNGLYEASGDWLYKAGAPAKSGVGGGIVAVIPGKLALAAFSPPLDVVGNSVKAQAALIDIINELELNLFK